MHILHEFSTRVRRHVIVGLAFVGTTSLLLGQVTAPRVAGRVPLTAVAEPATPILHVYDRTELTFTATGEPATSPYAGSILVPDDVSQVLALKPGRTMPTASDHEPVGAPGPAEEAQVAISDEWSLAAESTR